jgi:hypothetical protein
VVWGRSDVMNWRRSSKPCESGACVEIASAGDVIAVRNSRSPDGPMLTFGRDAWADFVAKVKSGSLEFV